MGPVHGIPVGIKDIVETRGIPTSMGSPIFDGHVPTRSATLVRAMEAAGAFVLGKTVTTEFTFYTPGKTRNPWNPAHTPGGSSSGSAAAVAMGLALIKRSVLLGLGLLGTLVFGFAVFLMRQFISTLPTELIEAAVIDGADYVRIFWEIILPLIGPALSALAIFNFIWMWNMFMWPTVVADTQSMMTVQVALSRFTSMYLTRYDLTMAAASITTLPILIIYLVLQRTFVKGIALTGMKQ